MSRFDYGVTRTRVRVARCALIGTVLTLAVLFFAVASASADYEQVPEHFNAEVNLQQAFGLAVNVNGVGLPPGEAGSVYEVSPGEVKRFSAGAEGEPPQLVQTWPLEQDNGRSNEAMSIAVDQATGNVIVLQFDQSRPGLEVFSATGTLLGSFGEYAQSFQTETIATTPAKLHLLSFSSLNGIAVDETGAVYVIDRDDNNVPGGSQARIMVFEQEHPGDYESYVYTGQSRDIKTPTAQRFTRVAMAGSDRLATSGEEVIRVYSTDGGSTPLCTFQVAGGGVEAMTANPDTGEIFFTAAEMLHRLGPCDEETGKVEELQGAVRPSEGGQVLNLALNPKLAWGEVRGAGVVYATRNTPQPYRVIGDIYAPAAGAPPVVLGESVANTGATTSTLQARIDPQKFGTHYLFQYLSEEEYEENEPSERQALTVSATGGLFGLGYQGRAFGGAASADLEAGSKIAQGLITAEGTGDFHVGVGTATLTALNGTAATVKGSTTLSNVTTATGAGIVSSASNKVTSVNTSSGQFVVGQTVVGAHIPAGTTITAVGTETLTLSSLPTASGPEALSAGSLPLKAGESISGPGIPSGTTIVGVGPRTLTLSSPVEATAEQITFSAASNFLTKLSTSAGTFEIGQEVSGAGIRPGTTITAVGAVKLTLSQPVEKAGTAVPISAGFRTVNGLATSLGRFEPGTPISGEGIPAGTTITAVGQESLTISRAPTKPGSGVALSSSGPAPLAVGETVEGTGIPAGTKVVAVEAGKLTLSATAESTVADAELHIGLPFDASSAEVQAALESLATIGSGNVEVSGGPGDAGGSHPYRVEFAGSLANRDLDELEADGLSLSGGSASIAVSTQHDGGGGFDSGATEVPAGGGEISGSSVTTVSVGVTGLSPATRYRFRVVASSQCLGSGEPACEAVGEPAAFSTYPETDRGLPDDRAFELVSPAQKNGGEAFPAAPQLGSCVECKPPGAAGTKVFPMQTTPDGDSVAYMGFPFSASGGAAVYNSYLSSRAASAWQTTAMSPELLNTSGGENLSYNRQLSEGLVFQSNPQLSPDAPSAFPNIYLQHADEPTAFQPLLTQALFGEHEPSRLPVDFQLQYAGSSPGYSAHYFTANDALTGETPYAPEPPDPGYGGSNLYEWRNGALNLVNVLPGNGAIATGAAVASASPDTHAIAADGRRIYWTAGGQLYVREDNRTTREIHHPGGFLAASSDGLEVLLSDGCLYSLETTSCIDLTEGQGGFQGLVGASDDLSKIYFVDKAALTAAAEAGSCRNTAENEKKALEEEAGGYVPAGLGCNLYLYEAGAGARYIATLSASDNTVNTPAFDWAPRPGDRTAQATPDGRYLAFVSGFRLTNEWTGSGYSRKVYLYDSTKAKLSCPSCNPTGEAPRGPSTLRVIRGAGEWFPQPHYLTSSGRLFFDTQDRLSPLDTNGNVEDVYVHEPDGVGSCRRAAGCVFLISPGSGAIDSNLLTVDQSGSNVFFTSRERLVQKDTDGLIDVYVAREAGGFPSETETQRAECQGESCQPVAQPPNDVTPASSAFHGAGNVQEAKQTGKKKHKKKHTKHKRKHKQNKKKNKRPAKHNRGGAK